MPSKDDLRASTAPARIVPDGLEIDIDYDSWGRPPIFDMIQKEGGVPETDMRKSFNLGVGLIIVVRPDDSNNVMRFAEEIGESLFQIGSVVESSVGDK